MKEKAGITALAASTWGGRQTFLICGTSFEMVKLVIFTPQSNSDWSVRGWEPKIFGPEQFLIF